MLSCLVEITNVTSASGQNVTTVGELILDCFTVPSDLPVNWIAIEFSDSPNRQLADDPRAVIQSTEYGSRLTIRNTTVEDSGEYQCLFNHSFYEIRSNISVTIIPGKFL